MSTGEESIGGVLATARAERGMSVEDVSARTRIRGTLIRAIEADDFSGCGGAVYARGHLRSIAAAVGVDAAPLVAAFDAAHNTAPDNGAGLETLEPDKTARREMRQHRGPNWTAAMVAAFAVITVLAGALWLFSPSKDVTHPPSAAAPTARPSTPAAPTRTTAPRQPARDALAYAGVGVRLRVTGAKSWVRVTDAGATVLYVGVLDAGTTKDFRSPKQIRLLIGDAGAVNLVVNGRNLGAPGAAGQVVNVAFGPGDPTAARQG